MNTYNQYGVVIFKAYKVGSTGDLIAVNKFMLQKGDWGRYSNQDVVRHSAIPTAFIKNKTLGSELIQEMVKK